MHFVLNVLSSAVPYYLTGDGHGNGRLLNFSSTSASYCNGNEQS